MKIKIIAEAGVNHNGQLKYALDLVDKAAASGADFIKFQNFIPSELATAESPKAEYQKKNYKKFSNQLEMLKSLMLSSSDYKKIINRCKKKGIKFLSSPFDIKSINNLKKLNLAIFKIPSGEINNIPYLELIGKLNKEIILSTGMSNIKEVLRAINILEKAGCKKSKITVLHCNTDYPTQFNDVNLNCIKTLQKICKTKVGLSDHTMGIEVPIAAAALGINVIEKHLTLSRKMKGPDHKASLLPREFRQMVCSIRNIEDSMGSFIKKPTNSELKNISLVRKSIVASKRIKRGELFTTKNITTKRPGTGLSASNWHKVLGKKSKYNFKLNDLIKI